MKCNSCPIILKMRTDPSPEFEKGWNSAVIEVNRQIKQQRKRRLLDNIGNELNKNWNTEFYKVPLEDRISAIISWIYQLERKDDEQD